MPAKELKPADAPGWRTADGYALQGLFLDASSKTWAKIPSFKGVEVAGDDSVRDEEVYDYGNAKGMWLGEYQELGGSSSGTIALDTKTGKMAWNTVKERPNTSTLVISGMAGDTGFEIVSSEDQKGPWTLTWIDVATGKPTAAPTPDAVAATSFHTTGTDTTILSSDGKYLVIDDGGYDRLIYVDIAASTVKDIESEKALDIGGIDGHTLFLHDRDTKKQVITIDLSTGQKTALKDLTLEPDMTNSKGAFFTVGESDIGTGDSGDGGQLPETPGTVTNSKGFTAYAPRK